jgi:predicted metal-dependent hydrolase
LRENRLANLFSRKGAKDSQRRKEKNRLARVQLDLWSSRHVFIVMHPIESHPDFLLGIRLFNAGEFWDSHEAIERVWKPLPKNLPERRFLQAIILLAAAFLHRERARTSPERSARPALRCANSALRKLEGLPDSMLGIDVATLRRSAVECFAPLESGRVPDDALPPPVIEFQRDSA